ncbi:uncharacterized protein LOC143463451 [Clavelina lepadiformis]|uniref:uncharacterized protein LOC143463451 n=1 Tax=Clavelina lepadiformis TaxID=159417 RepID=UPI0040414ECE
MAYHAPRPSVKARLHQFESAVATAEHFAKHPDQERNRRRGHGSSTSGNDSEEDDEGIMEFADLVRALTLNNTTDGGGGEVDALREAFKILDCDEDGFITLSDLREAMQGFDSDDEDDNNDMTDEELVDMIAAADDKGSGRISFESFVKILEPSKPKENRNFQSKPPERRSITKT